MAARNLQIDRITLHFLKDSRLPLDPGHIVVETTLVSEAEQIRGDHVIQPAYVEIAAHDTESVLEAVNEALVRAESYEWRKWVGHLDAGPRNARERRKQLGIASYADSLGRD